MIIGGAAINTTPIDWDNNKKIIVDAINEAKLKNIDLLCFPELSIPSYGCQDLFLHEWVTQKSIDVLFEIVPHTNNIAIAIGLPLIFNHKLYNCIAFIDNGEIKGFYAKHILANDGVHYEYRWFTPWNSNRTEEISINNNSYPIGHILFKLKNVTIGIEICEDAWHDNIRPANSFDSVDIILNPSASHFAFGKNKIREQIVQQSSEKYNCYYLYTNLLGNESGKMIYDGDIIIGHNGNIIKKSETLLPLDCNLCYLNIDETVEYNSYREKTDLNHQFLNSQTLALFDYLRKSKSNGFTLSLSGGADSSTIAVLISEMVKNVIQKTSIEYFKRKLIHIQSIQSLKDEKDIIKNIATFIYQQTSNSSKETFQSANKLAEEIGAEFIFWNIEEQVISAKNLISNHLNINLNWQEHDVALQNIQARMRSPLVWMVANIKNQLLLATSNRSESSVGYATMDGDTSGSLSPLSGVDKPFILNWLKWAQFTIGYSSLQHVNKLTPSAELRPLNTQQADELDLMPYDILNKIEHYFVYQKLNKEQIIVKLENESIVDAEKHVKKYFELWKQNQWKRERYAPSFHIDSYSLDPKSWARYPILSGSY